jgi:hypothetical protein
MELEEYETDALDGRHPANVAEWVQHYVNTIDDGAECEARMGFYEGSWLIVLTCPGVDDLALPVDNARELIRVLVRRVPVETKALIAALIVMIQHIQDQEANRRRAN